MLGGASVNCYGAGLHANSEKCRHIRKSYEPSIVLKVKYLYFRYVTSDDVVELKGKVACEISTADELTITELMFSGALKDSSVEQMVALLSCFVWQEKLQDAPKPREELDLLFYQLQETARRVANLQLECKVVNSTKPSYQVFIYNST
jgi:ATP-dependent RNA helicase DOB1